MALGKFQSLTLVGSWISPVAVVTRAAFYRARTLIASTVSDELVQRSILEQFEDLGIHIDPGTPLALNPVSLTKVVKILFRKETADQFLKAPGFQDLERALDMHDIIPEDKLEQFVQEARVFNPLISEEGPEGTLATGMFLPPGREFDETKVSDQLREVAKKMEVVSSKQFTGRLIKVSFWQYQKVISRSIGEVTLLLWKRMTATREHMEPII